MTSFGDRLWRTALWIGLIVWSVSLAIDAIRAEWLHAFIDVGVVSAYAYVLCLEHTLDRWAPFVPPSMRKRP